MKIMSFVSGTYLANSASLNGTSRQVQALACMSLPRCTSSAMLSELTPASRQVCYLCDSETEQVEWISAFEGTLARIVKLVAGVEDEPALPAPAGPPPRMAAGSTASEWARQLEAGFSAVSRTTYKPQRSSASSTARVDGNTTVSVLGYGGGGGGGGEGSFSTGGGGGLNGYTAASSATPSDYGGFGTYSSVAGYGNVAGAKVAPAGNEPLVHVDYGYPTAPAPSSYSSTQTAGGPGGSGYDTSHYAPPAAQQQYGYGQEASAPYHAQAPSWQQSGYEQQQQQQGTRADAYSVTGGSYMDQAPSSYGAAAYPTMQPTVLPPQSYSVRYPMLQCLTLSTLLCIYAPLAECMLHSCIAMRRWREAHTCACAQAPETSQSSDTGWTLHSSPDGRQYQYNTATGESRWAASDWLH